MCHSFMLCYACFCTVTFFYTCNIIIHFYIALSRLNGDEIHETRLHAIMIIALLHPVEAFNESVNRTIDGSYTLNRRLTKRTSVCSRVETQHTGGSTVSRRAQQRSTSSSVLKMVHIRHRTGPRFNKQRSPVSVRPNAKYGVNDVQIQIRICRCVLLCLLLSHVYYSHFSTHSSLFSSFRAT